MAFWEYDWILYKTLFLLVQILPLLFLDFCFAIIVTSLMKVKLNVMKKTVLIFISFLILLSVAHAQKGIDYNKTYPGGGRLLMSVDSTAKNVYYGFSFSNLPNNNFSYLPGVDSVSTSIYFRKTDDIENYRYTILVDDKPLVVNKSIDKAILKEIVRPDDDMKDEVLDFTTLGAFPLKDRTITILIYSVETPLNIQKSIFSSKPFPKAKIKGFIRHFKTDKGFEHSWITEPKEKLDISFTEKDYELTLIKDKTDIDYLYYTSIRDKKNNKVIFESTAWDFSIQSEDKSGFLASIKIDKSLFKKSGDYEIIIEPLMNWEHCWECGLSADEIETYRSRYTLSVTMENESYSQKEVWTYLGLACSTLGILSGLIMVYIRRKNAKKLAREQQQKNIAKLQLSTIRSQLNPHFMFNALSGIQNLMNKNEVDNANKYLAKFARLTRTVLDDKELISLLQEKKLLDDYLQMEQLRFGFGYEIKHTENLDLDNIEIPSMLLQPFVENAVKHGVTKKGSVGIVVIWFAKRGNDLLLTVTDNGNGFDTSKETKGLGLQLSKNRIALLNSIYKENHFNLAMQSSSDGTRINITLIDWL